MLKNKNITKSILNEWKNFLNNPTLLTEISRRELETTLGPKLSSILFSPENRQYTNDNAFLDLINNTFKQPNNNHSLEDVLGIFDEFKKHVSSSWNKNEIIDFNMAGRSIRLERSKSTYDDVQQFIELKNATNVRSTILVNLENSQTENNIHFDVIVNDVDWYIAYPKTQIGSMFLGRSYWNVEEDRLKYDYTFNTVNAGAGEKTGKISWCTVVSGGANMFMSYHGNMRLNMYYCIKKRTDAVDVNRKLCISIAKKGGKVEFFVGNASVNAENEGKKEDYFKSILQERYELITQDVERNRDELDVEKYYSEYNLEQLKITYDTMETEEDFENFGNELELILKHTKDFRIFDFIYGTGRKPLLVRLVKSERTSDEMFERLCNYPDSEVKAAVLHNPKCTKEMFVRISKDPNLHAKVKIEILRHYRCTQEIVERFSYDSDPEVKAEILLSSRCTKEMFERIYKSNDFNINVKIAILNNPNCTVEILEKIFNSNGSDLGVKIAVAKKSNCPVEILEKIFNSNDSNLTLKFAIVSNPNCTEGMLKIFANYKNFHILSCVIDNSKSTNDILETVYNNVKQNFLYIKILEHHNCSVDLGKKSYNKLTDTYKKYLADSQVIPTYILEMLSNDPSSAVRCALLKSNNCTREIATKLSTDESIKVKKLAFNKLKQLNTNESLLYSYLKLLLN